MIINRNFVVQLLIIVGANLAMGFMQSHIDNFGHIGGLVGGYLACGATGFYRGSGRRFMRWAYLLGFVAVAAAFLIAGVLINKGGY